MRTDKISFKSRINFVNYKDFNKFRRGKCVDFRDAKTRIIKADEFFFSGIESDISGGLIDTKNKTAIGFSFDGRITDKAQVKNFLRKLCTAHREGCNGCLLRCPFYKRGYDKVKKRYERMKRSKNE